MRRRSWSWAVALYLVGPDVAAAPFQSALLPAGIQAAHVHHLWLIMLGVCGSVFTAVLMVFLVALWRAPRSTSATPGRPSHSTGRERGAHRAVAIALGVSTAGLMGLLVASVATDRALAQLPLAGGVVIEVTGQQWWWQAVYAPGDPKQTFETANELHIPVGRPVLLRLQSPDVIHSFWVPNLAPKKDMIPGHTLTLTLQADKAGVYRGQCAEFCGYQHAKMAFVVVAEAPEKYEQWAHTQRASAKDPVGAEQSRGREIFMTSPCVMCHAIQGTPANAKNGPDLTHLAGRMTLAAGTLPNTAADLAAWIANPQQSKPGVNMPAVDLSPADLQALVSYLGALQ